MAVTPEKITVNNFDYNIVVELKKKKNSSAKVYGDTIVLRISNKLPRRIQKEHVLYLLDSITKKLEQRKVRPVPYTLDISEGFDVIGKEYTTQIKYAKRKTCRCRVLPDDVIEFILPDDVEMKELSRPVRRGLLKVLAEDNQPFLEAYTSRLNDLYFKRQINKVSFKPFKSKWGECNSRREISVNVFLLFCPIDILEYILIHEIAHIDMLNHSKEYWKRVDKALPNRKKKEEWLKNYGNNILNSRICW